MLQRATERHWQTILTGVTTVVCASILGICGWILVTLVYLREDNVETKTTLATMKDTNERIATQIAELGGRMTMVDRLVATAIASSEKEGLAQLEIARKLNALEARIVRVEERTGAK